LSGALLAGNLPAFVALVIAALGTTLYVGRMFAMVFLGEAHGQGATAAKESSPWMTVPLIVLGVIFSLDAGLFLVGTDGFPWLDGKMNALFPTVATPVFSHGYHELHEKLAEAGLVVPMFVLGIVILVIGLGASILFYRTKSGEDRLRERAPVLYKALEYRYMDTLYAWYIAKVQQRFAMLVALFDMVFVNLLAIRGVVAGIPAALGAVFRRFIQNGNGAVSAFWTAFGALAVATAVVVYAIF